MPFIPPSSERHALSWASFTVTFPQPVFGVAIFFNAGPTAAVGNLFIDTPVGMAGTGGPIANYDFGTFFFAGLISDTPFLTARIGAAAVGPTTGFNVDNLTFVREPVQQVPEPTTLLLLGSGLIGVVGLGRRGWSRTRRNFLAERSAANPG